MPSPFPGMDPYLESPDWFPDLHDNLIFSIKAALQGCLPAAYYARSRQRVWLELEHRPVEPDVDVLRAGGAQSRFHEPEGGAVAVAELATTEPVVVTVESIEGDPFEEPFLEIRRRQGTDDVLVASMEILSPSNKTQGNSGRVMYLAKQQEILKGPVHLIEIDLLRGGTHSTAVPKELAVAKTGPFDYHVLVHRFDQFKDFYVYPILLREKLPTLAIPLLPGDPDIPLDLQAAFDRAYDGGPYRRVVHYGEDPILPPLRPDQAEWVKSTLRGILTA